MAGCEERSHQGCDPEPRNVACIHSSANAANAPTCALWSAHCRLAGHAWGHWSRKHTTTLRQSTLGTRSLERHSQVFLSDLYPSGRVGTVREAHALGTLAAQTTRKAGLRSSMPHLMGASQPSLAHGAVTVSLPSGMRQAGAPLQRRPVHTPCSRPLGTPGATLASLAPDGPPPSCHQPQQTPHPSRRHALLASAAGSLACLLRPAAPASAALVQFPASELHNRYVLVRAGESYSLLDDATLTNPGRRHDVGTVLPQRFRRRLVWGSCDWGQSPWRRQALLLRCAPSCRPPSLHLLLGPPVHSVEDLSRQWAVPAWQGAGAAADGGAAAGAGHLRVRHLHARFRGPTFCSSKNPLWRFFHAVNAVIPCCPVYSQQLQLLGLADKPTRPHAINSP